MSVLLAPPARCNPERVSWFQPVSFAVGFERLARHLTPAHGHVDDTLWDMTRAIYDAPAGLLAPLFAADGELAGYGYTPTLVAHLRAEVVRRRLASEKMRRGAM
jgi:hypothetical protein